MLGTSYWLGFSIISVVMIKMLFGERLAAMIAASMEKPDQAELEEKIFVKKFNEYDKDKGGTLDKNELSRFIQDLGIYVPEEDMPGLIATLDSKGDGKISFNKLQAWFRKINSKADDIPAEEVDGANRRRGGRSKKSKNNDDN